jgi:hypothetical protein
MKVSIMLADSAQEVGGKFYLLGGGWSMTGPDPMPFAIVVDVKVPWDVAHRRHTFTLELLDQDGNAVILPDTQEPLRLDGTFETLRRPGLKEGTPIDWKLAVNLPPQPIPPGGRYEWRLSIDGQTESDWYVAFAVRDTAGEKAA